jgi:hypothetical protein
MASIPQIPGSSRVDDDTLPGPIIHNPYANLTQKNPVFKNEDRVCAYLRFKIGSHGIVIELTKQDLEFLGTFRCALEKSIVNMIKKSATQYIMKAGALGDNDAFMIYPTNDTSDDAAAFGFSAQEFLMFIDGNEVDGRLLLALNRMRESFGI